MLVVIEKTIVNKTATAAQAHLKNLALQNVKNQRRRAVQLKRR